MKADDQPPPLACHLDTGSYQQRTRRFAALNREFLLESLESEFGCDLIYSLSATAELRELVRLEQECCPFLGFQLEPGQSSIKLTITLPENARDAAGALLEPFRQI